MACLQDVYDPDDYQKFFSQFGEVVFVTIAKNNGDLLRAITAKKVIQSRLLVFEASAQRLRAKGKQPKIQDSLPAWKKALQPLGLFATEEYLRERLKAAEAKIRGLSTKDFKPRKVFIIFNLEDAQRKCLKEMSVGKLEVWTNSTQNTRAIFNDRVLNVIEPVEPSEVIWENLHIRTPERLIRYILALAGGGVILFLSFLVVSSLNGKGGVAAVFISLLNLALPQMMKVITALFERPVDQSDFQQSVLTKLVIVRMVNTALLLYLVTPYEDQMSEDTLTQVFAILIADCFTTPVFRLLNVVDWIKRYVIAPRSRTQAQMNRYFRGAIWNLAERYTDVIKTLFVGLFYSSLLPQGLFITAFSFITTYWVDKYSLLRLWKRPPSYDASLAVQSRHLVVFVIWVHLIITRVFFANWPYQNRDLEATCSLLTCKEPSKGHVADADDDAVEGNVWTHDQEHVVQIYSTLSVVATFYVLVPLASVLGIEFIWKLFRFTPEEVGEATQIPYRTVAGIEAYIPMVLTPKLVDPLLALDVSLIPQTYLPLRMSNTGELLDPRHLSVATLEELPDVRSKEELEGLFSICKFYPGAAGFGQMADYSKPLQQPQRPANPAAAVVGAGVRGVVGAANVVHNLTAPIVQGAQTVGTTVVNTTESLGVRNIMQPAQVTEQLVCSHSHVLS